MFLEKDVKENYNSVVSTWIHNSIKKSIDINVFDRNIQMHYVYIQDVVEFISSLNIN